MANILLSKAETSYIRTSLNAEPPLRADGRGLLDYRPIALETGSASLANGSARVRIGAAGGHEGMGTESGTEVLAGVKLEVEDIAAGEGVEGGRIVCTVICLPSAYPHLAPGPLDDLSNDMSTLLNQVISHPSLHPTNLGIIPRKKSWLLNLDCIVRSDEGNVYDALFIAARAALWDTKVPRTRSVEYEAKGKSVGEATSKAGQDDVDMADSYEPTSGLDTRKMTRATDFELPDYWDEGEPLEGRDRWPVCVTSNIVTPVHYLDASAQEEASTSSRLLVMYFFPTKSAQPHFQGVRLLGPGEITLEMTKLLLKESQKYAQELHSALETKLQEEELRRNEKARRQFASRR